MKKLISNKPFVILLAVFISTVFYFVYEASEAYEQYDIPFAFECNKTTDFSIYDALEGCDSTNILSNFDYQLYLEKGNYCDFNSLQYDMNIIDNLYNDPLNITEILFYRALADTMINNHQDNLNEYNPEYLINQLGWIERYSHYSECYSQREFLYGGIYEKWMQTISNKIISYVILEPSLKYKSKFKIIVSICKLDGYIIPIGVNSVEKIADYLVEGKYSYIWNRFMYSTSFYTRFLVYLIIGLTSFTYIYTLNIILKKKKNEKNH